MIEHVIGFLVDLVNGKLLIPDGVRSYLKDEMRGDNTTYIPSDVRETPEDESKRVYGSEEIKRWKLESVNEGGNGDSQWKDGSVTCVWDP